MVSKFFNIRKRYKKGESMKKNKTTSTCSMLKSEMSKFHVHDRRVLLRIDGNVPLLHDRIESDFRLQALLPTLTYLQKSGATTVVITHVGRPKEPTPHLSTQLLLPWFQNHGFSVRFAQDSATAYRLSMEKKKDIILLENLRFFPGEKKQDPTFVQELARLGDFFVTDAWATLHRHDASITQLPYAFPRSHRTIGYLVEHELQALSPLCTGPQQPFTVIMGGGKPETKIPIIKELIGKAENIIICPALSCTFMKAEGKEVGASYVAENLIAVTREILTAAYNSKTHLIFPIDYQVLHKTRTGPITTVSADTIPQEHIAASVGPRSIQEIENILAHSKTIFFNCTMGFPEYPATLSSSYALLHALAASDAYTVVAGGNSVDLVFQQHLEKQINYLSTGGGATLAYIAGKALPGLDPYI